MGAIVGSQKSTVSSTALKTGPYETICQSYIDKKSPAFKYLQDFFPKLTAAKVEAGVLIGPQIKKVMECKEFPKKTHKDRERAARDSFVTVVLGFLENHKAENYVELGDKLRQNGLQDVPQSA